MISPKGIRAKWMKKVVNGTAVIIEFLFRCTKSSIGLLQDLLSCMVTECWSFNVEGGEINRGRPRETRIEAIRKDMITLNLTEDTS